MSYAILRRQTRLYSKESKLPIRRFTPVSHFSFAKTKLYFIVCMHHITLNNDNKSIDLHYQESYVSLAVLIRRSLDSSYYPSPSPGRLPPSLLALCPLFRQPTAPSGFEPYAPSALTSHPVVPGPLDNGLHEAIHTYGLSGRGEHFSLVHINIEPKIYIKKAELSTTKLQTIKRPLRRNSSPTRSVFCL